MCLCPNYAIYIKPDRGVVDDKPFLKFIKIHPEDNYRSLKAKYGESLLSLPCGECEQCRRDYATQWAIRCALESSKYKYNWFITLTYDNTHYRNLNKEDIQEFLFNLAGGHKERKFKYWLAGEYGPQTNRAHYHMILMNYDIEGKPIARSQMGYTIYESKKISEAWGKGYVEIQEAGDNAMAYCAKYAAKSAKEYNFRPMMSKSLGLDVLMEEQEFICKYGYIQGKNGKKYKVPRYFFKKINTMAAKELKNWQKAKGAQKTAEKARYKHLEIVLDEEAELIRKQVGRRSKV